LIDGVAQLVPALFYLVIFIKNPVHGANGAKIVPLIKQRCIDLARGKIDEPIAVEGVEYALALPRAQGSRRGRPLRRMRPANLRMVAVVAGPGYSEGLAGGLDSHICREGLSSFHQLLSSGALRVIPRI